MNELNIVLANGMSGAVENEPLLWTFIRDLAQKHENNPSQWAEKYGCDFHNEIFMMHPFCWCEKTDCPWCNNNENKEDFDPDIAEKYGMQKDMDGDFIAPNFWYKPLDFKVWWYKYIGRSMNWNKTLTEEQFTEMVKTCMAVTPAM